jgi:ABC-type phosphate/phosphonate transport system substrate-binding protein
MRPETFRMLASTDRIPYDAYCVSDQVSDEDARDLEAALLALEPGSDLARKVFGAESKLDIIGYVEANDGDFDSVRVIEHYLDEGDSKPKPKAPE